MKVRLSVLRISNFPLCTAFARWIESPIRLSARIKIIRVFFTCNSIENHNFWSTIEEHSRYFRVYVLRTIEKSDQYSDWNDTARISKRMSKEISNLTRVEWVKLLLIFFPFRIERVGTSNTVEENAPWGVRWSTYNVRTHLRVSECNKTLNFHSAYVRVDRKMIFAIFENWEGRERCL